MDFGPYGLFNLQVLAISLTKLTAIQISGPRELPICLDLQVSSKDHPLIIFCHGYKGFKDWGAWNLVSNSFCKSGFNFLKFNFSYNGGTPQQMIDFPDLEAFGNNNYSTELDDLNQVISWAKKGAGQLLTPVRPIFLIGHSRGGAISVLGASENDSISGLATWGGVSDFDTRFPIGEELKAWKQSGIYYVDNKRTNQRMPHYYQFFKDFQKNMDRLDIRRAARSLKMPYLILHGTQDEAVHFTEAMRLRKWALHAQLEIISAANHTFGSHHPYDSEILPEWLAEAVQATSDYFKKTLD